MVRTFSKSLRAQLNRRAIHVRPLLPKLSKRGKMNQTVQAPITLGILQADRACQEVLVSL